MEEHALIMLPWIFLSCRLENKAGIEAQGRKGLEELTFTDN